MKKVSVLLSKNKYCFFILLYSTVFGLCLYFYYPSFLEIEFNIHFIFEVFWKSIYINSSFLILVFLILKYKNLTLPKETISNIGNENVNKSIYKSENLFLILNYVGIILWLILHLIIMFVLGMLSIIFGVVMIKKRKEQHKYYGLMLIGLVEAIIFTIFLI